jgi:tRNA threonylcarbamoyladenosine biosynthesis protein TsaE
MTKFQLYSNNPERTREIGLIIGKYLQPNDLILLSGNLGSGKTCLTQGIAWGLDIKEYTASPTFDLIREYQGRLPLFHIDLYRLETDEDMMSIGIDDYVYGNGVCVIEWAEKGINLLPPENLSIYLYHRSECEREIIIQAHGTRHERLLKTVTESL